MKPKHATSLVLIIFVMQASPNVGAALVEQTTGANSAVSTADRSALFNSLETYASSLSAYSEDSLWITTPGYAYAIAPFAAFNGQGDNSAYYCPSSGNYDWVTVRTTDGKAMQGVEFLYGNNLAVGDAAVIDWQAYVGADLVSGSTTLSRGTILGFQSDDARGFDSLMVRARDASSPGGNQAIALDDLRVQLVAVPEPSTYLAGLSTLGMLGAFGWKNHKSGSGR